MRLFTEIAFATTLTLAAIAAVGTGNAHDTKVGALVIDHPWSRQSPMAADVAAGFLTIANTGSAPDRLLKATAAIAGTVQLHDMRMDGDMMKMVELPDGIPIPAGATVELKPKSLHIMFLGIKTLPKAGATFAGTLVFEKAGTAEVTFHVMSPDAGMN